jgi:hypothetical protein
VGRLGRSVRWKRECRVQGYVITVLGRLISLCWVLGVQALLQMQDIPSAISVMQYYTTVQPSVR